MKKVYLDELESTCNELVNYSQNSIANKIEELKQAPNNFVWQGLAYDSYVNNFNTKIDKLIRMNNSLTNLAKFLLSAEENYNNANERINNAYEELIEEIKKIRE